MQYNVAIKLAMIDQDLPLSAPDAFTTLLSQLLAADGVTVVATATDPANPVFIVAEGEYVFQSSGTDEQGQVIGAVFNLPVSVNDAAVVPVDGGGSPVPTTKAVSLPGSAVVTVTRVQP